MKKVNIVFPALGIAVGVYLFSQSEEASASSEPHSQDGPGPGDAVAYIKKHFPFAQSTESLYAVPALVTIAQAGIESGWGKSNVAQKSNNHFGIKADSSWHGPKFGMYRKYNTVQESFDNHAKFLSTNKRYNKAFLTTDPKKFLYEVAQAKYSENPDYNTIVSKVIDIARKIV